MSFEIYILDTVLTNNVIATYKVTSHAECMFHCNENEGCQSYNYVVQNTEEKLRLCEINNRTVSSCPSLKTAAKEGHGYFEEMNEKREVGIFTTLGLHKASVLSIL